MLADIPRQLVTPSWQAIRGMKPRAVACTTTLLPRQCGLAPHPFGQALRNEVSDDAQKSSISDVLEKIGDIPLVGFTSIF